MYGLLPLPWWGYLIVILTFTQLTIFSVTLYLHRCQAHRSLELHPLVSHFFRFWLWLTTGMITKEWAAIHRKHHAKVETAEDPHSPQTRGIKKVFFEGAELYREAAKDKSIPAKYGQGTPEDWIERNLYGRYNTAGLVLMAIIDICCFGLVGVTIWAIQMAWIPFFAAGVVNGLGHFWGYRNYESKDASRNLFPIGFFIGGEELHNNHHAYATSAKFSSKWWEFDIGWLAIQILSFFRLAKAKRTIPKITTCNQKNRIDAETIRAVIHYRLQLLANYKTDVLVPALKAEKKRAGKHSKVILQKAKALLSRDRYALSTTQQKKLQVILDESQLLNDIYEYRLRLQAIWNKHTASSKELMHDLQEWCKQAEATGIDALFKFSQRLRHCVLA